MSWAEVKKINSNMSISLDELLTQILAGGQREYIYESRTYIVPYSGVYTIRAFEGLYGSYGKVVKNFTKGEILTITISSGLLTITSNLQDTSVFHINLTKDSYVNSSSGDSVRALAIGGSEIYADGGSAYVRSNNGIAAGGGGSGGGNHSSSSSNIYYYIGHNGGAAYAWGNNVYALGGGGGGSGLSRNSSNNEFGIGGNAYINGVALNDYCSINSLTSGKGYNGENSHHTTYYDFGGQGGNGGCGGGCGFDRYAYNTANAFMGGGYGYFSDGGYINGASARGGDEKTITDSSNSVNTMARSPKGYFIGGSGGGSYYNACNGGTGGFLGGDGGNAQRNNGGNGGYSPYGFGGNGGWANNSSSSTYAGKGGDGKIFGGKGGEGNSNSTAGNGGNGYYPGKGGKAASETRYGSDGIALTNNLIIGTAPLRGMTPTTSIVIVEYGDSPEDF